MVKDNLLPMMPVLRIMTTTECNNNCSYCFVKTAPNYKVVKGDFKKIYKSMQKVDYSTLEIIGGEPFHDVDLLRKIFEVNDKPVVFFTSGTYNTQEAFNLCVEYFHKFRISFNFSYDGKHSLRNGKDSVKVRQAVRLFKTAFPVSIRWSINIEDIQHLVEHFKEIHELGIDTPIFFPMKYKDYSDNDIELFKTKFQELLDYCIAEQINFNGILDHGEQTFSDKADFVCPQELTILPDGRFTSCYVAYSSFGFPENLVSETPAASPCEADGDDRCEDCLNVFNCCNKCVGNLREYQLKTGNGFHHSYCDLIEAISLIYMKSKLRHDPCVRFEFYQGGVMLNYVQAVRKKLCHYKLEDIL